MAPGPTVQAPPPPIDYHQLVDPNAKWWKNSRLVKLNLWILLLYVSLRVIDSLLLLLRLGRCSG